jgi:hypothetical protein
VVIEQQDAPGYWGRAYLSPYLAPANQPEAPDITQTIETVAETASRLSVLTGSKAVGGDL